MIYCEVSPSEPVSRGDTLDECPLRFWRASPSGLSGQMKPLTRPVVHLDLLVAALRRLSRVPTSAGDQARPGWPGKTRRPCRRLPDRKPRPAKAPGQFGTRGHRLIAVQAGLYLVSPGTRSKSAS